VSDGPPLRALRFAGLPDVLHRRKRAMLPARCPPTDARPIHSQHSATTNDGHRRRAESGGDGRAHCHHEATNQGHHNGPARAPDGRDRRHVRGGLPLVERDRACPGTFSGTRCARHRASRRRLNPRRQLFRPRTRGPHPTPAWRMRRNLSGGSQVAYRPLLAWPAMVDRCRPPSR